MHAGLRRRITIGLITTAGLSVAGALLAGPAMAHADLVSSDPADGAVMQAPPASITLTFSDPLFVDGVQMSLVAADGSVVPSGPPTVDGASVSLVWPSAARSGSYEVGYRVVSEDGHPVSGSIAFTVQATEHTATPSTSQAPVDAQVADEQEQPTSPADDAPTNLVPLGLAILAAAGVAVVAALAFGRRKR